MRRDIRAYWLRRVLSPIAVFLYAMIAINAVPRGNLELFPFFNWSLFSKAMNPKSDVVVTVTALNGQALRQPRSFYDMGEVFAAA